MIKHSVVVILVSNLVCICLCGCYRKSTNAFPLPVDKAGTIDQKMTIQQLKELYAKATSEHERRGVCLRAIDDGAIFRTGPVSTVDEIFGTSFSSSLPDKREGKRFGVVHFAKQPPETNEPLSSGKAYGGWFLAVEFDYNGEIQNYYLTNLHK